MPESGSRGGVLHAGGEGGSPCRGGSPCLVQGVCVCVWSGGGVLHGGGGSCQTPPVNRMTNRCKNITLAKTSFRPVIMGLFVIYPFVCTFSQQTWRDNSHEISVSFKFNSFVSCHKRLKVFK